ncbi:Bestrophin, RFP-TM, chloride channel-domain-containing protein [Aspergillus caelatus]|uniref:Bestrophin, RFP-TM, chloride channel-domain-containing protein n=2 Tax=Aspergillus subgen. Circumdati TaxID=2720871 RepID=A0A5N7AJG3_9EURO|nr:Bestrophin, RFP-TM, chloride channel-domain-containing protein [Aspergillus caelatus]KAE8369149.1 Bestrophin, RFP-TM, chloride channel-domain-containing protein [Aspergillus caelatus]KAE8418262.1 Bestrophin, RFP-TM, chloride channel-domain-containing protein [Aspergillus pseudocaelatus]
MEGHSSPPAAAADVPAQAGEGPAPVQADIRSHAVHHDQGTVPEREPSPGRRITPRPTFLENLANTRDTQFMLDRRNSSELDRYFHGPRDLDKHSKWPTFLRMHGSVLPKMILPLSFVAAWATLITLLSKFVHPLGINNILLTVTGFVVGLALSFRSSTAYERWADGRKYWSLLIQTSRNLARTIWINTREREGELGKEDLLQKLTAMNLILAFAVALKHKLRFEPDIAYEDLAGLVGYLDTFAKDAHDRQRLQPPRKSLWKSTGEYLGVSFAESNPRKLVKRSKKPLGHLPLEILNHLSAYIDRCITNETLSISLHQAQAINGLAALNEVVTGTERVLDTPLPTAYSIAIAQIAWIYVMSLPFQLYNSLTWVTIPGSIVAAYIILGLATIGSEIENPFGQDVNDLPLDTYCRQIALELDIITATPAPRVDDFTVRDDNLVLYPLSMDGYNDWKDRSVADIRAALRTKVVANSPAALGSDESTVVGSMSSKQTV